MTSIYLCKDGSQAEILYSSLTGPKPLLGIRTTLQGAREPRTWGADGRVYATPGLTHPHDLVMTA